MGAPEVDSSPSFPLALPISPDLRAVLDEAAASFAAARERLEANERALAALPGSAWERARPPAKEEALALRAHRRRLMEAMWPDLLAIDKARRAVHLMAALAVVRARNFDAAVALFEGEPEWLYVGLLHSAFLQTEHAVLRLDLRLDGMLPELRAEAVALTQAIRSSLAYARPQIAVLPRVAARDRVRLARDLCEEIGRAHRERKRMRALVAGHGGDPVHYFWDVAPRPEGASDRWLLGSHARTPRGRVPEKPGTGVRALLHRLARRVRRSLTRLVEARRIGTLEALCDVDRAWSQELSIMRDAITHHARNDGDAAEEHDAPAERRGPAN
jgi:hypothetical protein